jgi:septal ring factor EnvC (AmiA/AmiB activator)
MIALLEQGKYEVEGKLETVDQELDKTKTALSETTASLEASRKEIYELKFQLTELEELH